MAAEATVTLNLDQGAIVRVVGGQSKDAARRAATKILERARGNLSAMGRTHTGALTNSLMVLDVTGNPLVPSFAVGSGLKYAIYQELGVGRINARSGGRLVFRPKGSGKLVFAKSVRGFSGAHYLQRAVSASSVSDFL
jgi:hypothetical protein